MQTDLGSWFIRPFGWMFNDFPACSHFYRAGGLRLSDFLVFTLCRSLWPLEQELTYEITTHLLPFLGTQLT